MKASDPTELKKIQPPHLSYSAFCLAPRLRTTCFLKLTSSAKSSNCFCPVKQKRALLKSNSPRDNWTEGDEIIRLHLWGAKNSPNLNLETFISEPSHALKNFPGPSKTDFPAGQNKQATLKTNHSNSYPFFRSKRSIQRQIADFNSCCVDVVGAYHHARGGIRELYCCYIDSASEDSLTGFDPETIPAPFGHIRSA